MTTDEEVIEKMPFIAVEKPSDFPPEVLAKLDEKTKEWLTKTFKKIEANQEQARKKVEELEKQRQPKE